MIYETNDEFPFSKLILCKPISTGQGAGNFFIRYSLNEQPLYIQPPKCYIKQIHTRTGKKMYTDLVFQQENEPFIQWMENLENHTQQILYDHRQQWFQTDLEKEDIEQSFTSPMKIYKSGKEYIIRANIQTQSGKSKLKIYNEDEITVPIEQIVENTNVMVILEVQGVRSTARNFQIDIEIKQMMVLKQEEIFNSCILKKKSKEPEPLVKKEAGPIPPFTTIHEPLLGFEEQMLPINDTGSFDSSPLIHVQPSTDPEVIEHMMDTVDDENITCSKTTNDTEFSERNTENDCMDYPSDLCEVDIHLDEVPENETISLKERKELYYKIYQEARQKAKVARDLALSSYLEAKQIKNQYMLDDILNSSSSSENSDESDIED